MKPVDGADENSVKDFPFPGFSMETVRSMMALMDTDLNGSLGFDEFRRLWTELRLWKTIFKKFDRDRSGTLNAFELRTVMKNIGFHVSNNIYKAIACRYANRNAQERLPDGRAVFEAEDFIRSVIYI